MIKTMAVILEGLVEEKNEQYVREAIRIWDSGEADIPIFSLWIKVYVTRRWFELTRGN